MSSTKTELVNDLIAIEILIEELWRFHPENPDREDVIGEYTHLIKMRGDIENELDGIGE